MCTVTLGTRKYIKSQAKKDKRKLPRNYVSLLKAYKQYTNCTLIFTTTCIGLNGSSPFCNIIYVSAEYGYQLLTNFNDVLFNAFIETLGHEEAHKEKELELCPFYCRIIKICPILNRKVNPCSKEKEFCNKVTEVHCDFRGVQKKINSNRKTAIEIFTYKKNFADSKCAKKVKSNSDKKAKGCEYCTHPTNSQRLDYITNYDFNESLVRRIAADIGFTDEEVISKACTYFEDIILN